MLFDVQIVAGCILHANFILLAISLLWDPTLSLLQPVLSAAVREGGPALFSYLGTVQYRVPAEQHVHLRPPRAPDLHTAPRPPGCCPADPSHLTQSTIHSWSAGLLHTSPPDRTERTYTYGSMHNFIFRLHFTYDANSGVKSQLAVFTKSFKVYSAFSLRILLEKNNKKKTKNSNYGLMRNFCSWWNNTHTKKKPLKLLPLRSLAACQRNKTLQARKMRNVECGRKQEEQEEKQVREKRTKRIELSLILKWWEKEKGWGMLSSMLNYFVTFYIVSVNDPMTFPSAPLSE